MSTIQKFDDKILQEQVATYKDNYSGKWTNAVGTAYNNVPILQTKPVTLPKHAFSEHNPLTTEKTNIFSAIQIGFTKELIKLFRAKWDIVVGYDDPRLSDVQSEFSNIMADLERIYDSMIFNGIVDGYGIRNNKNTKTVSATGITTIDDFVSFISTQIDDMIYNLGSGDFVLMLPLGWYSKFNNVDGTPPDVYVTEALNSRATRMGIKLAIFDTETLSGEIYLIRKDDVIVFFGQIPQYEKSIYNEDEEEIKFRFVLDTTAVIIERYGAVRRLTNVVSAVKNLNTLPNLRLIPILNSESGELDGKMALQKNETEAEKKARKEAERKAKEELEEKEKAEKKAREEAEKKAKEEAERLRNQNTNNNTQG